METFTSYVSDFVNKVNHSHVSVIKRGELWVKLCEWKEIEVSLPCNYLLSKT